LYFKFKTTMKKRKIAIIGGGPAGYAAAISAAEFACVDIYEKNVPLKTVLWTGNGRCNLTHDVKDFKELASHYPRGERFLYSVLSRFGEEQTLDWFESMGLKTYAQEDGRVFPQTGRAATVREALLKKAASADVKTIKSLVREAPFEDYDAVVLATGGKNHEIARKSGHTITPLRQSLAALNSDEQWIKGLAGVSVKGVAVRAKKNSLKGDVVFTHNGLSGPVILDTSAYCAYSEPPYRIQLNLAPDFDVEGLDAEKTVSNALKKYIPRSLGMNLLNYSGLNPDKKTSALSDKEKRLLTDVIQKMEVKITGTASEGGMVTAGGVDLKEINPKTMESKLVKNLYFCGEVLDIDGLTGGFNLQMCWSTGYIAGLAATRQM